MISLMRTIIDIPDQLIESLDRMGTTHQKSRAALVREAIAEFLRAKSTPAAEAAFGIWKQRKKDGVKYQADLRREWESR